SSITAGIVINSSAGSDTVNVGSSTNTLDGVQGPLGVNGSGGFDILNINDQGSTKPHVYTQTATTLVAYWNRVATRPGERASKGYLERLKAAQIEVLSIPRRWPVEAQLRRAPQQRLEHEAALQPRQRRPQAKMRPEAERHVLVVLPADVQLVRVRKLDRKSVV